MKQNEREVVRDPIMELIRDALLVLSGNGCKNSLDTSTFSYEDRFSRGHEAEGDADEERDRRDAGDAVDAARRERGAFYRDIRGKRCHHHDVGDNHPRCTRRGDQSE